MPIEIAMDPLVRNVTIIVQLIAATMVVAGIVIALLQYLLQRREVIKQNQKIIKILSKIYVQQGGKAKDLEDDKIN